MKVQAAEHEDHLQPLSEHETSSVIDGFADFPKLWAELPPIERQAFGQLLFPTGYVYQQIRTTERGLMFRLFEGLDDTSSVLVHKTQANPNDVFTEIRRFLAIVGRSMNPEKQAA